ncbi:MAG TPA: sialidase family protein [Actinomycetota bacterium]|nr:sialidase family protein [Actinomycetota bacterium]
MRRSIAIVGLAVLVLGLLAPQGAVAQVGDPGLRLGRDKGVVPLSGVAALATRSLGTTITECPQAGLSGRNTFRPLDRREIDRVEVLSDRGDDVRTNTDYSCFPQNETSVAVNPKAKRNLISGQNDYRTRSRQGFNSSTDGGTVWYSAELPPPSVPNQDILDASGDPVYIFDREGIAYSSSINFNRTDDENGIMVQRSTNGGFTWSRPCVDLEPPCEGPGDPRTPGDGVVTYFDDPDNILNGSQPFDDKEWMTSGPRPEGVEPACFDPEHQPVACDPALVGVDRLYVTWTRFTDVDANIMLSYSDDQGRSWSEAKPISGNAPFCFFGAGNSCDFNQFSVPTVHPRTGLLGVAFENFNTPDENQYLFVRSEDGGETFEGPFHITPVFDVNYPTSGTSRPDCTPRGQQTGRSVLTNTCFRVNAGGNVVVDKRGGDFADDFYLVMSDNRNGTEASSNTDVFFFKSTNGGETWIGPSRVNKDRSDLGGVSRDCAPTEPECLGNFGNDQWFPWMDVNTRGVMAFGFNDRRLDKNSTESEWPSSRQRPGNYLSWFWGAGCRITRTATVTEADAGYLPPAARQCLAPSADVIPKPTEPPNPGPDPVPGQGQEYVGPFHNQVISDVASNHDYSFRGGIFMGDYSAVAYPNVARGGGTDQAAAFWTDSRNGRGSGGEASQQPGRNPGCEQSDVFLDFFNPLRTNNGQSATRGMELFDVTPCPGDATG